jgi:hypothetical protein
MRQLRTLALGLTATSAAVFGVPASALACSCLQQTLTQQFDNADYVLVGTVTEMEQWSLGGRPMARVTFDVGKQWKGPPNSRLELTVDTESASCGLPFLEEGGSFLLFLTQRETLDTNLCAGNRPIDPAGEDFSELDAIAAETK